jgi:PEP-CTERM motif
MNNNSKVPNCLRQTLLYLAVSAVMTVTASAAPVTFGQFLQQQSTNDFSWTNTSGDPNLSVLEASTSVWFRYSNIVDLPSELQGDHDAVLSIAALASESASNTSGVVVQPIDTGFFMINLVNPIFGQTLLLGGTFQNGFLTGQGGSAGFSFTTLPLTNVMFVSDFLDFDGVTLNRSLAFSFSSLTPSLAISQKNKRVKDFTAAGTGTFSSDVLPRVPGSEVPEPMSMVLMGTGLLAVGFLKRKSLL